MKHLLLTTIAAVLVVGCGSEPNYSGNYTLNVDGKSLSLELKPDGSFIVMAEGMTDDAAVGTWKVEGDLLVGEGASKRTKREMVMKFNKTTLKLTSLSLNGREAPIDKTIPEGADGHYFKKN